VGPLRAGSSLAPGDAGAGVPLSFSAANFSTRFGAGPWLCRSASGCQPSSFIAVAPGVLSFSLACSEGLWAIAGGCCRLRRLLGFALARARSLPHVTWAGCRRGERGWWSARSQRQRKWLLKSLTSSSLLFQRRQEARLLPGPG